MVTPVLLPAVKMGVPENEVAGVASIVSACLTNRELNVRVTPEMVLLWKKAEADRAKQADFVSRWAAATGRTGKKGKQSRQGHLRKLAKHGLDSDYARKMAVEAHITI